MKVFNKLQTLPKSTKLTLLFSIGILIIALAVVGYLAITGKLKSSASVIGTVSNRGSISYQGLGAPVDSNPVTTDILSSSDNPPTANITSLTEGQVVWGPVNINVDASDDNGIARVEFWVEGTKVQTITTAPYTYKLITSIYPDGFYHISTDAFDTTNQSARSTVGVIIQNRPVISEVATSVSATSSTVTWKTDIPATTQVCYGTTTAYGTCTTLNSNANTNHSANLAHLRKNTDYYFKVISTQSGNNAESTGQFKTPKR